MTIEEFNETKWSANMQCAYAHKVREVASVNFAEKLVGLCSLNEADEIDWVRCENIKIV